MDKVIQSANALHRDWLNTRLVVLLNSTDKMAPISHTIIRFLMRGGLLVVYQVVSTMQRPAAWTGYMQAMKILVHVLKSAYQLCSYEGGH